MGNKKSKLIKVALASTMLLTAGTGLTLAIDRNNEDEVIKIDARSSRFDCRQNEVLVKFKPSSAVKMRANKAGKYATAGVSGVDAVMQKLGAQKVEELMPLTGKDVARKMSKSYAGVPVLNADLSKLYRITFDVEKVKSVHEAVEMISALDEVEFAEPNYLIYSNSTSANGNNGNGNGNCDKWENEPLYSQQWGIQEVNLHHLWKQPVITEQRPIIGILDTGVDIEHTDLADNIWTNPNESEGAEDFDDDSNGFTDDLHGWDFINQTGRIGDWNGHGTHCAGIAAGVGVNSAGVAGANPDALIMPVTVLQSDGVGDIATLIKGIDYAVANGADVISMSLGTYAESIALEQSLAKAYQKAVLVAAAGNDGICIYPHKCPNPVTGQFAYGSPSFPAAYTFVLGVQASGKNGMTSWSNYDEDGPIYCNPIFFGEEKLYNYELMAPGQQIISTFINGQYKNLNGTSMATPLVAGAISRLITCKDYSNKEILFGDLIHSTTKNGNVDFFAAYSITDEDRQPTLHHVTNLLDDAEGGDGDNRPDAGETIRLYPTLRNDWGNAMNIRITLEIGENEDETLIEFIENDVAFGNDLSSYAKGKSVNPIVFKLRDDVADGRHIKLRLRATCDNISEEMVQDFVITAENGVEIGGMLREDLTLYPNVHYIVTTTLIAPQGVTLTILPGTVLKFKENIGFNAAKGSLICSGTPENPITFTMADLTTKGTSSFAFNNNTLEYVIFENIYISSSIMGLWGISDANLNNCIIFNCSASYLIDDTNVTNCNVYANKGITGMTTGGYIINSNYVNNNSRCDGPNYFGQANKMRNTNSFNNIFNYDKYHASIAYFTTNPNYYTPEYPCYLGTGRTDIAETLILDYNHPTYPSGFGELDLSNMLTRPVAEAHGVVWKVVVNGYDAQDEYELLPPLGVGKHKFEVYFNRPMNKEKAPMIAMGVRPPYTQTAISEEGAWNDEGTIYTAYLTLDGQEDIDGVNRIYVAEAEDDEFFEIPYEDYRFNVNVQSAGAMSEGFMAEAGLGKVNLTWENPEENFDDMLGYNLYRYSIKDEAVTDTIRINKTLIEPADTEYTDFDVVPGETYCYYYKVLRTSLTENSASKTVAATPLTAAKGDANGSMSVDVADVVTEVAYMTNQNPQPFIFEAADVNADLAVNVLDVVGTVNIIRNPGASQTASINSTATYTVEDGIIYVDSPVALGGIQFRIMADKEFKPEALEALDGFEFVTDYQAEQGWLIMAYSMSGKSIATGKQALIRLAEGDVTEAIFSDSKGQNVMAICGDVNGIGAVEAMQMQLPYPNPFSDVLNIPYLIGQEGMHNVRISITTPAGIQVARHDAKCDFGYYNYTWRPAAGLDSGIYFVTLYVDDRLMQTARVIYRR